MSEQLNRLVSKINALTLRERALVLATCSIVMIFFWWFFYAAPLQSKMQALQQQTVAINNDIHSLNDTAQAIQQRLAQGVHQKSRHKLQQLKTELEQVRQTLQQKTHSLIEPDDMFELMQQMIFAESKLKLTGIRRKQVQPLFSEGKEFDSTQPEIYRHIMQISFDGRYLDVLKYIQKLEQLDWQLIWDSIELRSGDYPQIHVSIEISTLSDTRSWVGL